MSCQEFALKTGTRFYDKTVLQYLDKIEPKAKEELEKAIQLDPTLIEARILLAKLYLEDREIKKAKSELTQALKLDPDSEEAKALLKIANRGDR